MDVVAGGLQPLSTDGQNQHDATGWNASAPWQFDVILDIAAGDVGSGSTYAVSNGSNTDLLIITYIQEAGLVEVAIPGGGFDVGLIQVPDSTLTVQLVFNGSTINVFINGIDNGPAGNPLSGPQTGIRLYGNQSDNPDPPVYRSITLQAT